MRIINNTSVEGPYPGKTWEALYAKRGALFPALIVVKIEEEECDRCRQKCDARYTCCSKACWRALCREHREDGLAEARSS
jgi:hypothetical protein